MAAMELVDTYDGNNHTVYPLHWDYSTGYVFAASDLASRIVD